MRDVLDNDAESIQILSSTITAICRNNYCNKAMGQDGQQECKVLAVNE